MRRPVVSSYRCFDLLQICHSDNYNSNTFIILAILLYLADMDDRSKSAVATETATREMNKSPLLPVGLLSNADALSMISPSVADITNSQPATAAAMSLTFPPPSIASLHLTANFQVIHI